MYTTASGIQIPQGTDAFNPPAQFKDWADGEAAFDNVLNVNLDSERTALTAPKLRDGVLCWVRATKTLWSYQGTTWAPQWPQMFATTMGMVGGTPPSGAKILEQAGTMNVNSNGSGDCGFTYPVPFPNGVLQAHIDRRDFSNYGLVLPIFSTTQTLAVLNFRLYLTTGAVAANLSSVPFMYRVLGW